MLKEVLVPDIGDFKDVAIIDVAVAVGDTVEVEASLITIETDKAAMDIPSPFAGTIKELNVKVGDKVSKNSLILKLDTGVAEVASPAEKAKPQPEVKTENKAAKKAAESAPVTIDMPHKDAPKPQVAKFVSDEEEERLATNENGIYAGPAVRRMAHDLGVNLQHLGVGSGRKGRLLKEDVQAFVKEKMQQGGGAVTGTGLPSMPSIDFSVYGPTENKPLSRIKKLSGAYLHRNWVLIPHVTHFDEADITELEAFRQSERALADEAGVRLTPLIFIMQALVRTLKRFPEFNASLDSKGETLILKQYYHIGVAVDTPNGLVVPVIRNVNEKGAITLARELAEVSKRARDGQLTAQDMQGSSCTISSLGGIGGTAFTPIINAPDVAILGVSKSTIKPVYDNGSFVPRLMLPLSLSYDHRVIDGAQAARFTRFLAEQLSDIRRLLF